MRATLHFSLLAATLSPSLVHSSPIPFVQNHNSSPRSSSQALSGSGRPGGAFSSPSLLPRGGLGLGLLSAASDLGGDGGDASSGSSYAQGGYARIALLWLFWVHIWYRDYMGDGDHSAASGGQPVVDLGPSTQPGDQPQPGPVHGAPPGDAKPGPSGPGDELPPPQSPDVSKGGTPTSSQPGPPPPPPPPPPPNTGDSITPPQKDPGGNGTPTDIPIFSGPSDPSNDRPSSGDIGPSSDPPWATEPHGDEKEFEDDDDLSCDTIFGGSLINILSNNGGDGGDASSGKATRQEATSVSVHVADNSKSIANGKGGGGFSKSGPGGDASGGSVSAVPALINILSNNGGNGGKAKSGDSSR